MGIKQKNKIHIEWNDSNPYYYLVQIQGRMDVTQASHFEAEIIKQIKSDPRHIALDLEKVNYMSSTGLGSMIIVQRFLYSVGKKMHLHSIPVNVMKIFKVVEVDCIFSIFETKDLAIADIE